MLKSVIFTLSILVLMSITAAVSAQNVGIGTASPAEKLHVAGNIRANFLSGVGTRVVGADLNGSLTIIAPGTNGQVLTQTAAGPVYQNALNIASTSLTTDYTVTSTTMTNIPGMSVTFTATKTNAMLIFSASGFAYTNSMAYVQFRVMNGGTVLGGTNTLTQNYDDVTGTVTPWSCTFTKNITGLTVGNSYTFQVQALRNGIYGTYDTVIQAATTPNGHHMTLSVMQ